MPAVQLLQPAAATAVTAAAAVRTESRRRCADASAAALCTGCWPPAGQQQQQDRYGTCALSSYSLAGALQVITVGLGSTANASRFCELVGYPMEGLYADASGAAYKALGFNPGFAAGTDVNPYLKLLPMLMGIGSPGTVQEVRSARLPCHGICSSAGSCTEHRASLDLGA